MRGGFVAITCIAIASTAIGCGGDDESDAKKRAANAVRDHQRVVIRAKTYEPRKTRVYVGGTVTFINLDDDPDEMHTAETRSDSLPPRPFGEERDFDTHLIHWKEPYTVTFHQPGTFRYHCSFKDMTGVIEVVRRYPGVRYP